MDGEVILTFHGVINYIEHHWLSTIKPTREEAKLGGFEVY